MNGTKWYPCCAKLDSASGAAGAIYDEKEWRQQVLALFEAFERRLDEFDRRLEQVDRRLDSLGAQADIWAALKERILTEDEAPDG